MKKIILILSSLLFLFAFLVSAENNIMYNKANQLYHNKNYDSAAKLYQQMLTDGFCSADLFYNAGNAYYRINKIGMAIWCYEKALQLHKNKNYSDNLILAQKRIKEPIEEIKEIFFIRWWQNLYNLFSMNTWSLFALILFLTSMGILFLKKLKRNINVSRVVTNVLFLLSGFCLLMLTVSAYNHLYHYQGIILESKTLFMYASKKEPIFLSEGIKIEVVDSSPNINQSAGANYVIVKLPDGRTGRIDRKSFRKL